LAAAVRLRPRFAVVAVLVAVFARPPEVAADFRTEVLAGELFAEDFAAAFLAGAALAALTFVVAVDALAAVVAGLRVVDFFFVVRLRIAMVAPQ
jgi:hypothetical protein